jgi:hypothetical protein
MHWIPRRRIYSIVATPGTPPHPSGNSNSLPFPSQDFLMKNCYNFPGFQVDYAVVL